MGCVPILFYIGISELKFFQGKYSNRKVEIFREKREIFFPF